MDLTANRSATLAGLLTILTVATQIIYLMKGDAISGQTIWGVETLAFIAISLFAFVPATRGGRNSLGWAALTLFGVFNVIQAGMGLTMFEPLLDAGEPLAPVFAAVLAMAFLLFFAAKILIGAAGIVFGLDAFRSGAGLGKIIGILAVASGIAAVVLNAIGIFIGRDFAMIAGGAGTAAALFVGLAIVVAPKPVAQHA